MSESKFETVGVMNKRQLDALLGSFPTAAEVNRLETSVTVHVKQTGQKVLSAVRVPNHGWHVMAVKGLITKTEA